MVGFKGPIKGGWAAVLTSCLCYFIPVSVIGSTAGKAEIRFRWDHSCHGLKNWSSSVLLLLRSGRQRGGRGADKSQPYAWLGFLSNGFSPPDFTWTNKWKPLVTLHERRTRELLVSVQLHFFKSKKSNGIITLLLLLNYIKMVIIRDGAQINRL